MADGGYRGTNSEQDSRFSDKEKKLLKQMKFEQSLDTKVLTIDRVFFALFSSKLQKSVFKGKKWPSDFPMPFDFRTKKRNL